MQDTAATKEQEAVQAEEAAAKSDAVRGAKIKARKIRTAADIAQEAVQVKETEARQARETTNKAKKSIETLSAKVEEIRQKVERAQIKTKRVTDAEAAAKVAAKTELTRQEKLQLLSVKIFPLFVTPIILHFLGFPCHVVSNVLCFGKIEFQD